MIQMVNTCFSYRNNRSDLWHHIVSPKLGTSPKYQAESSPWEEPDLFKKLSKIWIVFAMDGKISLQFERFIFIKPPILSKILTWSFWKAFEPMFSFAMLNNRLDLILLIIDIDDIWWVHFLYWGEGASEKCMTDTNAASKISLWISTIW